MVSGEISQCILLPGMVSLGEERLLWDTEAYFLLCLGEKESKGLLHFAIKRRVSHMHKEHCHSRHVFTAV